MTFMNVLIILWTIAMGFVSRLVYRRLISPCFFLNIVWCVCSTLSTTGAFGFTIPSMKTHQYIFTFLVAFSIASLVFHMFFLKMGGSRELHLDKEDAIQSLPETGEVKINIEILASILILFILFISPTLAKSLEYILSGNLSTLRNLFMSDSQNYMGNISDILYRYIIRPYIVFLDILAAYAFGKNFRQKWSLLILALVGSFVHVILSAGRMMFFELMCYVLISILLYRPKSSDTIARFSIWKLHINITRRGFIILIVLLPIVAIMLYITTFRSYSRLGVMGSIWQYSVGAMSYFDIVVNRPNLFGLGTGNYLFGKATFGFITGLISVICSTFLHINIQTADSLVILYSDQYFRVASNVSNNAQSTIIYAFLLDWGVAGLVIGPILIAFFMEFICYKADKNKESIGWNLALISMYYMLLFSIWRYTLMYSWTYMAFFWIFAFNFLNNIKFRLSFKGVRHKVSLKTNMTSPDKRNTVMVRK